MPSTRVSRLKPGATHLSLPYGSWGRCLQQLSAQLGSLPAALRAAAYGALKSIVDPTDRKDQLP